MLDCGDAATPAVIATADKEVLIAVALTRATVVAMTPEAVAAATPEATGARGTQIEAQQQLRGQGGHIKIEAAAAAAGGGAGGRDLAAEIVDGAETGTGGTETETGEIGIETGIEIVGGDTESEIVAAMRNVRQKIALPMPTARQTALAPPMSSQSDLTFVVCCCAMML